MPSTASLTLLVEMAGNAAAGLELLQEATLNVGVALEGLTAQLTAMSTTAAAAGATAAGGLSATGQAALMAKGSVGELYGQLEAAAPLIGIGAIVSVLGQVKGALEDDAQAAVAWQTELTQIQGNTGQTTAATEAMGTAIRQVSVDGGANLKELGAGYMYVTDLQFQGADATKVLTSAMQSAESTGGNVATTAKLLASVLHEYGLSADQAATTTDQLHLAAQRSGSTFEAFADSAGKALGVAANLNVPIDQVVSALSALTLHGYSAAEASTQVTNILTHLAKPSQAAAAEFDNLATNTGHAELASKNLLTTLSTQGLTGILNGLHDAYLQMGLSEAQATEETFKLLNAQRGGLGAATLMGQGAADYTANLKRQADVLEGRATPTMDAYTRTLATVEGQTTLTNAATANLGLTIGTVLAPALEQQAVGQRAAADAWTTYINTSGSGAEKFDAAIRALTGTFTEFQQQQIAAGVVVAREQGKMADAAKDTAIAAASSALSYGDTWETAETRTAKSLGAIGTAIEGAKNDWGNAWDTMTAFHNTAFTAMDSKTASATQSIISKVEAAAKATEQGSKDTSGAIVAMAQILNTVPPELMQGAYDKIQTILDNEKHGATLTTQQMNDQMIAILQDLTHSADAETAAMAQAALDHFNDLKNKAKPVAEQTGIGWIDGLMSKLAGGDAAINAYVTNLLRTYDLKDAFAILGKNDATAFINELAFGVANGLNKIADDMAKNPMLAGAAAGLRNTVKAGIALYSNMTDQFHSMNTAWVSTSDQVAAANEKIADSAEKAAKRAGDAAAAHQRALDAHARALAAHQRAVEAHAAAVAKAQATAATAATVTADSMIKDLGRAELVTVDKTKSISQAYSDLVPILTAKLPAGMEWLHAAYTKLLGQIESATPPTLDQVGAQFEAWNARILQSGTATQKLLAQANLDAYHEAEAKLQEHLNTQMEQQQRAAASAAKSAETARQGVLTALAGMVDDASKPGYSLGALMTKEAKLAEDATAAGLTDVAAKVTQWAQLQAQGVMVPTKDMVDFASAEYARLVGAGDLAGAALLQTWKEHLAAMADADAAAQTKRLADLQKNTDAVKAQFEAQVAAAKQAGIDIAKGLGAAAVDLLGKDTKPPEALIAIYDIIQKLQAAGHGDWAAKLQADADAVAKGVPGAMGVMTADVLSQLSQLSASTDPLMRAWAQSMLDRAADAAQAVTAATQKAAADAQRIADQAAAALATAGQSTVRSLESLVTETGSKSKSVLDIITALMPLLKTSTEAGMQGVTQTIQRLIDQARSGVALSMEDVRAALVGALQQAGTEGGQAVDLFVQQAIQHLQSLGVLASAALAPYQAAIAATTAAIEQDKAALVGLAAAQKDAQAAVQAATQGLTDATAQLTEYKNQLSAADSALKGFQSTQVAGTAAQTSAGQANKLQQSATEFAIAQLKAAGTNPAAALAALQDELAKMQSTQAQVEQGLADQIAAATDPTTKKALQDQLAATHAADLANVQTLQGAIGDIQGGNQVQGLKDFEAQLKDLQGAMTNLDLTKALNLTPLQDLLGQTGKAIHELPFADAQKGASDAAASIGHWQDAIVGANKAVDAAKKAQDQAKESLALATAAYQAEQEKIAALNTTLQAQQTALAAQQTALLQNTAATTTFNAGLATSGTALQTFSAAAAQTGTDVTTNISGMLTTSAAAILQSGDPHTGGSIAAAWFGPDKGLLTEMVKRVGTSGEVAGGSFSMVPFVIRAIKGMVQTGIPEAIADMSSVVSDWAGYMSSMKNDALNAVAAIIKAWQSVPAAIAGATGGGGPPPAASSNLSTNTAAFHALLAATVPLTVSGALAPVASAGAAPSYGNPGPIVFNGPVWVSLNGGPAQPMSVTIANSEQELQLARLKGVAR